MKAFIAAGTLCAALLFSTYGIAADQTGFDRDRAGSIPAGAVSFSGNWAIRAEADAPSKPNALCQTGSADYPAISLTRQTYRDASITVRFKPITGREDQAAGIIFRIQDKNNYYIARANALENNVNIYVFKNGRRNVIKEGFKKVVSGQWQQLRVEMQGSSMRVFLNGELVVQATDNSFQTGKIGLWTKADSVTCFDDFEVKAQ